MDLISELKELGANTEEAIGRFLNNAALYKKMLLKFPDNIDKIEVLSFIDAGDYETALANAHSIKGITGNLSLTPLYISYSEIVRLFREDKPQEARSILIDIIPVQEQFISCIRKYM